MQKLDAERFTYAQGKKTMIDKKRNELPELFGKLLELGCFDGVEIYTTSDGFWVAKATIADILANRDISTVPGKRGNQLDCRLFFDDWYIYAVSDGVDYTYSLFKMREQEYDAKLGRNADGDTPGITIPFISLHKEILLECLQNPTTEKRIRLNKEINRVVADQGQRHSEILKQYFVRSEAQGAYLIAKLYTGYIASLAENGCISVPERYACDYQKNGVHGRITRFVEENNKLASSVICNHEKIYIGDPFCPTEWECNAILATHTGNTSLFSFAAEVQFHAKLLTWWAKIPIPGVGRSPYASAIRADMSIGDAEFVGPTPYYRANSRIVKKQYSYHKDIEWSVEDLITEVDCL